jgi:signal transduction histidine kinase/ActR/RegA family two-component response regulator
MNEPSDKIQRMRDQQLTRGMRVGAILGFFAVLSSLSRVFVQGWHFIMYVHVALYLVFLGAVLLRSRLSYSFRASVIVITAFLLGVFALTSWGLMAFGLASLYSFCILSTILFGARAGMLSSLASIVTLGIIGACARAGVIVFRFNVEALLTSPASWVTAMFAMALSAGIIVITLGTAHTQVEELVRTLEKRNEELLESNLSLRYEISERVRGEEQRKKLEEKLRTAQKMEAIGTLAGGVAHDLNNILGGIVGYPDLLLEELPSESPMRDTLESIKKSGIKAAAIVNDMLTLARRRIDSTEVVNLNSVVSEYRRSPEFETLRKFHPLVAIDVHLDDALMNIHGSPFHLSKMVMNLVSNAAEAMPDGGRILIATENRNIAGRTGGYEDIQEGAYAVLYVADTGIGIPREDLERIFEPFYSKKRMGRSGTGLGMAVVWGCMKDHNGYIDVESVEGVGTKFILYFPVTEQPVAQAISPSPRREFRGRGESILVVDDVREQREIASKILKELGYSVHALGSGEEAVEYLRRASADLLILDMIMDPGMDGLETYRRIAEIHPGQKALITTGFAETVRINEALGLGVGGYLKKPYLLDQMGLAVRTELDRRPRID